MGDRHNGCADSAHCGRDSLPQVVFKSVPHGPPSGGLFCCPLPEVLFRGKARIHAGDYPLKGQSVRHVRHGFEGCVGEDEGPVVPALGGRGCSWANSINLRHQSNRPPVPGRETALSCRYTFRKATGKKVTGKNPGKRRLTRVFRHRGGKSHGAGRSRKGPRPVGNGGGTTLFCQK